MKLKRKTVCAAILGGGQSQRFGSNKALLKIDNQWIILSLRDQLQSLKLSPVFLVVKRPSLFTPILESPSLRLRRIFDPPVPKQETRTPEHKCTKRSILSLVPCAPVPFDEGDHWKTRVLGYKNKESAINLIRDFYPRHAALYGILTALKKVPTPYVFITACDMPFPNLDLLRYLLRFISQDYDLIIPHFQGHFQPLFAMYHKRLIPFLETARNQKKFALHRLVKNWISHSPLKRYNLKIKIVSEKSLPPTLRLSSPAFFNINTQQDWRSVQKKLCHF